MRGEQKAEAGSHLSSLPNAEGLFLKVPLLLYNFEMGPFAFFFPSSLEGGRFSSHCRSGNSACRDSPACPCQGRPSSPRDDNLGCARGTFDDYFLGSGRKTTCTVVSSKPAQ